MFDFSFLNRSIAHLRARRGDMAKYAEIVKKVRTADLLADTAFQRQFTYFYRLRRDAAWRKVYFELFAECRGMKKLSFEFILGALYRRTGWIEPSFSSKMLAALNPRMPIWDSIVLRELCLKPRVCRNKEERLTEAAACYGRLSRWYKDFLAGKSAAAALIQFDIAFPEFKRFSKVKKIDFLLWAGGSPKPFDGNRLVFETDVCPPPPLCVADFNMMGVNFVEVPDRNGGRNGNADR